MPLVSLCCGRNMTDAISTGKISSAKILSSPSCLQYAFFSGWNDVIHVSHGITTQRRQCSICLIEPRIKWNPLWGEAASVDVAPEILNPWTSLCIKVPLAKELFITAPFLSGMPFQRILNRAHQYKLLNVNFENIFFSLLFVDHL